MPAVLYKKERALLQFIIQFQQQNGYSPKLREMADALGNRSVSTVHAIIKGLVDKGYMEKVDGNARTLKVLQPDVIEKQLGIIPMAKGPTIALPLMGYIAAGRPLEPYIDGDATFDVASSMISGQKPAYVLQVKGNSMIEDGIFEGDYVVVEKTSIASDGDIVVALVDDNLATMKRFFKEGNQVILKPANSEMEPIYPNVVRIQGIVVGMIRRFNN